MRSSQETHVQRVGDKTQLPSVVGIVVGFAPLALMVSPTPTQHITPPAFVATAAD